MNSQKKLLFIKKNHFKLPDGGSTLPNPNTLWLIARIEQLTDALKDIESNWDHDSDAPSCRCCIASKALEENCLPY